ncbi:MAG: hypothetical protein JWL61_2331 [Gemmatimonadetes bacterium]|nr:hypothetical protein [Gemmatimonadota bacterium]
MPKHGSDHESAAHGPNVWVVRHQGGFSIKEEGSTRYLIPPVTQRIAIEFARLIARASRSELIVQSVTGRIRARDSHGFDPSPPKG